MRIIIQNYFDPMFYLCSDEMPFVIRLILETDHSVDRDVLASAANAMIRRFPYFAVEIVAENGYLVTKPNPRPLVVYEGPEIRPLGGDEVNRHLVAFSYVGSTINFFISHVMSDGCGSTPFLNAVLYEYFRRMGLEITEPPQDLRLPNTPLYDDETGNPYPEALMETAKPLGSIKRGNYLTLSDGPYIRDKNGKAFFLRVPIPEMLAFNHGNDASPCSLIAVLMARAIREVHKESREDIVCAVSFNLRPALKNQHNYRMLCNQILLRYPYSMKDAPVDRLCTCSRGMITLQSQPENALAYAQSQRLRLEEILQKPTIREKRELMQPMALFDANDNTFSVSYVGQQGFGDLEKHLRSYHVMTDGSTLQRPFVEVIALNGEFQLTFNQGFSTDVYYRAFVSQLLSCGLTVREDGQQALEYPKMILPE